MSIKNTSRLWENKIVGQLDISLWLVGLRAHEINLMVDSSRLSTFIHDEPEVLEASRVISKSFHLQLPNIWPRQERLEKVRLSVGDIQKSTSRLQDSCYLYKLSDLAVPLDNRLSYKPH